MSYNENTAKADIYTRVTDAIVTAIEATLAATAYELGRAA
jgi:hypothetical protein